jgi:hypothetical protein
MVYIRINEKSTQAKRMIEFLKTMSFVEVLEKENILNPSEKSVKKKKSVRKSIPNKETLEAMEDAKSGKVNKYKNTKELFSALKQKANV